MSQVYASEQCAICKGKDFVQDYEGGPLICKNCGAVGKTEPISEEGLDDLANYMKALKLEEELPQEYKDLLLQHLLEEKARKENRSIEEMMSDLKVGKKKRRIIRKRFSPYRK